MSNTSANKSWSNPDCPRCKAPVMVRTTRSSGGADFCCEACGTRFDADSDFVSRYTVYGGGEQ